MLLSNLYTKELAFDIFSKVEIYVVISLMISIFDPVSVNSAIAKCISILDKTMYNFFWDIPTIH